MMSYSEPFAVNSIKIYKINKTFFLFNSSGQDSKRHTIANKHMFFQLQFSSTRYNDLVSCLKHKCILQYDVLLDRWNSLCLHIE